MSDTNLYFGRDSCLFWKVWTVWLFTDGFGLVTDLWSIEFDGFNRTVNCCLHCFMSHL